jgi:hypothetical protein
MRTISTRIDIEAPAQVVWTILTDFPAYSSWNPFVVSASGKPVLGEKLAVEIALPGRKPMTFRPTLVELEEGLSLTWLGKLGIKGLFDGRHTFQLEVLGERMTRFHHSESFSGLLIPMMWSGLQEPTQRGFRMMNEALKSRSEEIAAQPNSVPGARS